MLVELYVDGAEDLGLGGDELDLEVGVDLEGGEDFFWVGGVRGEGDTRKEEECCGGGEEAEAVG